VVELWLQIGRSVTHKLRTIIGRLAHCGNREFLSWSRNRRAGPNAECDGPQATNQPAPGVFGSKPTNTSNSPGLAPSGTVKVTVRTAEK